MQITRFKKLIAVLLMMSFIGQVLASVSIPCAGESSEMQGHQQMMNAAMMSHTQQATIETSHTSHADNMSTDDNNFSTSNKNSAVDKTAMDKTAMDCCPDCDCVYGGSFAALMPSFESAVASHYSTPIERYTGSVKQQLITSLFRPPITR